MGPLNVSLRLSSTARRWITTSCPPSPLKLRIWTTACTGAGRARGSVLTYSPSKSGGVGVAVCRFYGLPSAGLDSHFYTSDRNECASIPDTFHGAWQVESTHVFDVRSPTVDGACAPGFVPVYRLWNQRA